MRFKKSIIVLLLLLTPLTAALALDWYNANQKIVGWDAITYSLNTGERVMYRVYLTNSKTDPGKTNPTMVGETVDTNYTLTFTDKGSYFVGIQSIIQSDESGSWSDVSDPSVIGWSDDPQYAQGGVTFGLRYYPAPPTPTGIHAQE